MTDQNDLSRAAESALDEYRRFETTISELQRELVKMKATAKALREALPGQTDPTTASPEECDKVNRWIELDPAVTLGDGSTYRQELFDSYTALGGTLSARRFYATLRALGYREGKSNGLHRFYGIKIYEG